MTQPVLVLGGAAIDILASASAAPASGDSTPGIVRSTHGGVGRNIAENLARLGLPVKLLSTVGDDADGHALLQSARHAGIDVTAIKTIAGASTARYVAGIDHCGEVGFAVSDMALFELLTLQDFPSLADDLHLSDTIVIDANLPEILLTSLAPYLQGKLLVCDCVSQLKCTRLSPLLPQIGLLKANAMEVIALLQAQSVTPVGYQLSDKPGIAALAGAVCELGVSAVLITLGEAGFYYADNHYQQHVSAHNTDVVSTNGAGDAALAALLAAQLRGEPPAARLRQAGVAAAMTCRCVGPVNPDINTASLTSQI